MHLKGCEKPGVVLHSREGPELEVPLGELPDILVFPLAMVGSRFIRGEGKLCRGRETPPAELRTSLLSELSSQPPFHLGEELRGRGRGQAWGQQPGLLAGSTSNSLCGQLLSLPVPQSAALQGRAQAVLPWPWGTPSRAWHGKRPCARPQGPWVGQAQSPECGCTRELRRGQQTDSPADAQQQRTSACSVF